MIASQELITQRIESSQSGPHPSILMCPSCATLNRRRFSRLTNFSMAYGAPKQHLSNLGNLLPRGSNLLFCMVSTYDHERTPLHVKPPYEKMRQNETTFLIASFKCI